MAHVAAARVSVSTTKPLAGRVLVLLWPRAREVGGSFALLSKQQVGAGQQVATWGRASS